MSIAPDEKVAFTIVGNT